MRYWIVTWFEPLPIHSPIACIEGTHKYKLLTECVLPAQSVEHSVRNQNFYLLQNKKLHHFSKHSFGNIFTNMLSWSNLQGLPATALYWCVLRPSITRAFSLYRSPDALAGQRAARCIAVGEVHFCCQRRGECFQVNPPERPVEKFINQKHPHGGVR